MKSLPEEIQNEVSRLRAIKAELQRVLPNRSISWIFYDAAISEAERAAREQDAVAMIKILPALKNMQ